MIERFESFTLPKVKYPHVHLSFDDHSIVDWYTARGVLIFKKAKAVFYVDSFDELEDEDIDRLRLLRADGHIIGCHSATHVDAVEYSKKHGVEAYIENEVIAAMESMASAGFSPTHFAFPYSSFNEPLYDAVSNHFCHVRLRPGVDSKHPNKKQMFSDMKLLAKKHEKMIEHQLPYESRIRNGDMAGVIIDLTNRMKAKQGINLVFHGVHSIGLPQLGSHADSKTGFITVQELDTLLSVIENSGASYETFISSCQDSVDSPNQML